MLLFVGGWTLFAANSEREIPHDSFLPPEEIVGEHPLAGQITKVIHQGKGAKDFVPTGLRKAGYLRIVNDEVRAMRFYQNVEGRIIDPVKKMEFAYSTPCYAHAVATLAAEGFNTDPELIRSGQKALSIAIKDMVEGKCANNHGDFYTYPVMLALRQFQKILTADQIENWMKGVAGIDPAKIYRMFDSDKNNWSVVNAAGEFLRSLKGLTSLAYTDRILAKQQSCFTSLGLYQEEGNPFAYDAFCRYFVSGLLHNGYRGPLFSWYRDVAWKGAWTSLMIQSPFGELPTCFRSSQHLWNEAELACVYEVYASAYAKAGRSFEAGMFKRGARLALQSLLSWIRPDGSGYVVKNRYPAEAEHGYERYTAHTCYNMLASSMLSEAWAVADDSIEEKPAPADVGGFVISIPEFDMVVANAGGAYVQYMTKGNQKYNPTGLIRIHLKKGHPQLGPSDVMIASPDSEGLKAWAVGLAWKPQGGDWCSLAEYPGRKDEGPQGNPPGQVAVLEEKSDSVAFSVDF